MAKSSKISERKAQEILLGTNFLQQLGVDKDAYSRRLSSLPRVEKLLVNASVNFIKRVQANLDKLGKVSTGTLQSQIASSKIVNNKGKYSLSVGYPKNSKAAKYYDYVNKGVKGVKSKQPDSPYKFKNEGVSPEFQKSIRAWIKINASAAKIDTAPKYEPTKAKRKRQALSKIADQNKNLKSLAYVFARSIKRKGIEKSGFFDKAVEQTLGKKFIESLSKEAKRDVEIFVKSSLITK